MHIFSITLQHPDHERAMVALLILDKAMALVGSKESQNLVRRFAKS